MHDLSKFSPTEFWESVKYFQGDRSPIMACREKKGYSEAWLHHKGRNKHHPSYWYDSFAKEPSPIIPYKYVAEMICDKISASMTYKGKNWKESDPMEFWETRKDKYILNEKIADVLTEVFRMIAVYGVKSVLTKKNKEIYDKHVNEIVNIGGKDAK